MTTIKRTATELGLKDGDEIRIISGDYQGVQGTLLSCDGSRWPYFKITKEAKGFLVGHHIALFLTNENGELLFERVNIKNSEGFIQNTGVEPEIEEGQLLDILYADGSLILDMDLKSGPRRAENTFHEYYATDWTLYPADIGSSIVAYRFPEDRPLVVKQATLDELLAELKAELVGVNSNIESLAAELEAAKATKAALLAKVEGHGLQFIGELKDTSMLASEAFERGLLRVGSVLLAVTPLYPEEHVAGKQYEIIDTDSGDSSEFKLQSEDGLGWWTHNNHLSDYTVVSL